jgi:predicted dehydrogenase
LQKYNFPNLKQYSIIEQAYEENKIDAVVICNPPQYHTRYIIDAIDRGIHVLTEKPLCTTVNELRHVMEAQKKADKNGIITAVNQQYRWNPRNEAIHNAVQDGLLGDIFLVNSLLNQNNYKFEEWWRQQELYISLFNWFVHQIDSMRYYLNQKPEKVWGYFVRPSHSKIKGFSSILFDVKFENNTFWHMTGNQECVAGPTTSGHTDFTMYGSKGTLINTKNDPPFIYYPDGQKVEIGHNIAEIDNESKYPPGWPDSLKKFIHSIRTKTEHPTSIKDNLWTISIMFAVIEAFEQKKEIDIREFLKKIHVDEN